MSKRFFYAQGQSAATRHGMIQMSPFWPHRNLMKSANWQAFTSGFEHQHKVVRKIEGVHRED